MVTLVQRAQYNFGFSACFFNVFHVTFGASDKETFDMDMSQTQPATADLRSVSRPGKSLQAVHSLESAPLRSGFMVKLLLAIAASLSRRSQRRVIVLGLLIIGIVGEIDIIFGPQISFAIFYLIPISIITWRVGRRAGTTSAVLSTTVWMFAEFVSGTSYGSVTVGLWNAGVRLGFFLIVTYTLAALSVMLELVRTDYLTGLANSRGFHDMANNEINRSHRGGYCFTVAYVDIDDFKSVNDKRGHGAGDELLRLVGSTLRKSTRRSDTVARLGGDEFAILLPETNFDSSASAIENIYDSLTLALKTAHWQVTFSIGAVTFQNRPQSVAAALDEADQLMYEAKHGGKDAVIHRAS